MLCNLTSDPTTSRHPWLPPERRTATKSVSTIKRYLHRHTRVCAARSNSCLYCTHYSLRHACARHPHKSTSRCYAEEYGHTLLVRCNIFHADYCWRLFRGCYDTLLYIQGTTTVWLYRNDCVDVYTRRLMCVSLCVNLHQAVSKQKEKNMQVVELRQLDSRRHGSMSQAR